ncbi:hypothetical protein DL237_15520 [Pseudooceanicola sediminis]|uniref:Uncharacterized protein n=1 Tax=Pseudooceanicola sediminis TaxID=2211117 RepID=A0A399IXD0_9RHOB|nr:hypothetical protein [Pseudooceanicola sediminis]KAA2313158.1 hypothetical protein E0K93_15150 [Puniceibacterium sp. HSS470]RII37805.1 hypothetical protein DL237_15520 [Pseudooceanicola sediminis]|tara:strand:- start:106212 stop:106427 length:216 start_codon:yes stop_codon:yes gene_type:complete
MEWMIWIGACVSLVGLASLVWSIVMVARAKRSAADDDALRAAIRAAMPYNMGGMFLSVLGLMAVIAGISLG